MFDNDRHSPTYGKSIAQYAYQLELQADVAARIIAAGGVATPTDPRQGRNIGLSAITAINDHEFLVLERDNRGIGVDDPAGASVVGSKRVYKIDVLGATDISNRPLPNDGNLAAAVPPIVPVAKSARLHRPRREHAAAQRQAGGEMGRASTIGPRLKNGGHLILAGNDNDYSVTQNAGSAVQFDVYVDFNGGSVQRDLDQPTMLNGQFVGPVPAGFVLLPGVLHAYKASAADLSGYVRPGQDRRGHQDDHDSECGRRQSRGPRRSRHPLTSGGGDPHRNESPRASATCALALGQKRALREQSRSAGRDEPRGGAARVVPRLAVVVHRVREAAGGDCRRRIEHLGLCVPELRGIASRGNRFVDGNRRELLRHRDDPVERLRHGESRWPGRTARRPRSRVLEDALPLTGQMRVVGPEPRVEAELQAPHGLGDLAVELLVTRRQQPLQAVDEGRLRGPQEAHRQRRAVRPRLAGLTPRSRPIVGATSMLRARVRLPGRMSGPAAMKIALMFGSNGS